MQMSPVDNWPEMPSMEIHWKLGDMQMSRCKAKNLKITQNKKKTPLNHFRELQTSQIESNLFNKLPIDSINRWRFIQPILIERRRDLTINRDLFRY